MASTTSGILVATLMLIALAAVGIAFLWAVLRIGPGRGAWNQPAAALREPGRLMFASMYALAAVHVVLGLVLATAIPGGGFAIFVVLVAMATFYVLCAHSWSLAHAAAARMQRRRNA